MDNQYCVLKLVYQAVIHAKKRKLYIRYSVCCLLTPRMSNLYGSARPKNQPIPISQSSIHSLSTELFLAKQRTSTSASSTAADRPRKKAKTLFSSSNKGVSARAARDLLGEDAGGAKSLGGGGGQSGLTDAELALSRRRMQEKAKLYDKLRKGEDLNGCTSAGQQQQQDGGDESLVDFTRKWKDEQRRGSGSESLSDSPSSDDEDIESYSPAPGEEMVEYTDEFGRTRLAPKSIAEKHRQRLPQTQTDDPKEPNPSLIYGPTIQTHAFTTATYSSLPESLPRVEDLPQNKPGGEERHYDANSELRSKGVGFYAFSGDNEQRRREMAELDATRKKTEEERRKREEGRKRRMEEVTRRREEIKKKKREVVGSRWLEGLVGELEAREGGAAAANGKASQEGGDHDLL